MFFVCQNFAQTGRIATIDNTPSEQGSTGQAGDTTYSHLDHLGSGSLETDNTGNVTSVLTYTPYGSEEYTQGQKSNNHTYTDQEKDNETGLMYYNARYYDTDLKRFTSVDPVATVSSQGGLEEMTGLSYGEYLADPQGFNTSSYARNNPLKYTDPTGNFYDASKHLSEENQQELGQAVNQWTQDSAVADFAVSNPRSVGMGIGVVSAGGAGALALRTGVTTFSGSTLGEATLSQIGRWGGESVIGQLGRDGLRKTLLNKTTTSEARKLVDDIYKFGSKIGNGSSMDAAKYELRTGLKVGGRDHVKNKFLNTQKRIKNFGKNGIQFNRTENRIINHIKNTYRNIVK